MFFFFYLNFFLLVLNYNWYKYTSFLQSSISEKLMKQYILMPYKNYFKRNTSELLRNIKDEVFFRLWCNSAIVKFINRNISCSWNIVNFILSIEFKFFFNFGFDNYFFDNLCKFNKKLINKLEKERFRFDENIIKKSNRNISKYKRYKIYFLEQKFQRLHKVLTNYADSMKKFLTMQNLPRLTIELTLVIILSLIIVLFAIEDINFEEASIKLGLFAAAAFRLLPSINKIISAQQILRFHNPSVNEIYKIKNDLEYDIFKFKNKINFSKKIY